MSSSIQDTATLINSLNATNSSLAKAPATTNTSETQDMFLTLLVAQMENQDPLNPLDNAQVTSQMAQLSTVSGIDEMNSTLQALNSSMSVSQSLSATSMIGHGVLVPGSDLTLHKGVAVGGMELNQPADNVSVTIKDAAGNVINTVQFGAQEAGVLPFSWDGKTEAGADAPDGNYTFTVEATLAGVKTSPATLVYGLVNAVTPGAQGVTLDVGLWGGFDLSSVKLVM